MWRLECGHRPIQSVRLKKPATGFPARAKSCDVEYMPVICPTCQIFLVRADFEFLRRSGSPAAISNNLERADLSAFTDQHIPDNLPLFGRWSPRT
jgi:hypothetical protein